MRCRMVSSVVVLIAVCAFAAPLAWPAAVIARNEATKQPAGSSDVYVIPFSHLDLFWAGTREECLSRGNRIITKAIQIAKQHSEFRFLLEDEVFVANYVESLRGSTELNDLKRLVKEGRIGIAWRTSAISPATPRSFRRFSPSLAPPSRS